MAVNYCYTDLSVKDAVYMEVAGVRYEVSQFTASWAANEVPTAAVMVPLGRDGRTRHPAAAHAAGSVRQMEKATVWFEPAGDFDRGAKWPPGRRRIFDGYFAGFAYRKVHGKVQLVGSLIHWLAALGFSSALTKTGHVSNPTELNAAAVLEGLRTAGGGVGNYVSLLVPAQLCADAVQADLWAAVKSVFCALAAVPAMGCGPDDVCGGDGTFRTNDVALDALGRVEGPAPDCPLAYKWGVPLKMETEGVAVVEDAVARAIGNEMVESYSGTTFWDKLVGQICPQYGMAVVPMVETAIVAADCPAFSGGAWRELTPDDYDSFDMGRDLPRPLRAVGVVAGYDSQTKSGMTPQEDPADGVPVDQAFKAVGGCYAESSVAPGDGVVLYVPSPGYLRNLATAGEYAGATQGVAREAAAKGATNPDVPLFVGPVKPADAFGVNVNRLYSRYAHEVYVNHMLRGQTASFSGKLRFDIAPLSILKLVGSPEKFVGPGQDGLAADVYGCVQRVTVTISAESGMAGTSFQLSHVRTAAENGKPRTSVAEHPLFGKSIHGGGKHGCPLIDAYSDLLAGDGPAPPPDVT